MESKRVSKQDRLTTHAQAGKSWRSVLSHCRRAAGRGGLSRVAVDDEAGHVARRGQIGRRGRDGRESPVANEAEKQRRALVGWEEERESKPTAEAAAVWRVGGGAWSESGRDEGDCCEAAGSELAVWMRTSRTGRGMRVERAGPGDGGRVRELEKGVGQRRGRTASGRGKRREWRVTAVVCSSRARDYDEPGAPSKSEAEAGGGGIGGYLVVCLWGRRGGASISSGGSSSSSNRKCAL